MNKMILDKNKILEYQQNEPPYLMIDFAEEVIQVFLPMGIWILKKMNGFSKFIGKMIQIYQQNVTN